jgi:hypothetical protein
VPGPGSAPAWSWWRPWSPLLARNLDRWNGFAALGPIEVLVVPPGLYLLTRSARAGRLPAGMIGGALTAAGACLLAGAGGLLKFGAQRVGPVGALLAAVALTGAALLLVSGWRRGAGPVSAPGAPGPDRTGIALASGGALLLVAGTFWQPYDGNSTLWGEVGEWESAEFFFEPAAALLLVGVALLVASERRRWAAGLLIGTGGLAVVHFTGVVIAAAQAIGEVGDVRMGGFLGVLGGLLALVGGRVLAGPGRRPVPAGR